MKTPYYQRTLESFADEIITKVRQSTSNGLWYATLDVGPDGYAGDPDFATCSDTREKAIQHCANRIRADARGIGKFAPHSLLVAGSYDLQFRLMRHWAEKEKSRAHKK